MVKLKPCPFCGFDFNKLDELDDVIYPVTRSRMVWRVNCLEYAGGCDGSMLGDSSEDAVNNWNNRPSPMLDKLKALFKWLWALPSYLVELWRARKRGSILQ